ncbi:tyrosine-type recombinase/integrase [Escherichia coli]|nr:tyrosine-type recombinase/integrase [Escherichia coli]
MYVLDQLSVAPNRRLWTLVDTTTNLPLLFPLLFLIDRLASRSESTQSSTLQALKFFYEYWYQKHDVTFCLSFQLSGYNPSIAVSELEAFLHYLESGKLMLPTLGYAVISKHNTNINHVHAVCRFINYLINTYVSPRYMDGTPKELSRYALQLSKRLSTYRSDFRPSKQKHSHKHFNSLTADMVRRFYEIIRPESSFKPNPLNPFPAGEVQFRNYLICRLLLNYGLRVSELLLLEKHSIKPNIQGGQFSIIVTSVDDDVRDPRKRLPSLKNSWAHRVLALDINDYNHLKIYIDKISKNTSHNFIFTSTKSNLPPLSYHSIYDIFSKIDCVFKKEYPQFSDEKSIDSVVSITPHVTRHTWAYLILKRIYAAKYQSVMRNCNFGLKILCVDEFPGFTLDDYEDLELIPRPNSNDWNVYQNIDNILAPCAKNMICKGLFEMAAAISRGRKYNLVDLRNATVLGLSYVTGSRPVQLAKLAAGDFRIDTCNTATGLVRYSVLLPYAKQRHVTTDRLILALPPEIGALVKHYIDEARLLPTDKMFNMGGSAPKFVSQSISQTILSFSPQDYQFAVSCGEAALPSITSTDLRHNVGHSLAMQGASAEEIAHILGHSSLVVAKHYIRATPALALIRAKALGSNPVWQNMVAMMLTGKLVPSKEWEGRRVVGMVGDRLHYEIGGCARTDDECPFCEVRCCYGCLYYRPFLDGHHQGVLNSVSKEVDELIAVSDSVGNALNPLISIHETTQIEIKSVIARCHLHNVRGCGK